MRGKIVLAGLILGLSGMVVTAQELPKTPRASDVYCSGLVTSESVPQDTYVITGEESETKITFNEGDYVYVNKGSDQGVKVGDEFSVIRSVKDPYGIEWSKWEFAIKLFRNLKFLTACKWISRQPREFAWSARTKRFR